MDTYSRDHVIREEVTDTLGGVDHAREYWARPKDADPDVTLIVDREDADDQILLEDTLRRTHGRGGRLWFREPIPRLSRDVWLGNGDASRKTFISPWHDAAAAPAITVDGAPVTTRFRRPLRRGPPSLEAASRSRRRWPC
jgi:hypothetical protein